MSITKLKKALMGLLPKNKILGKSNSI